MSRKGYRKQYKPLNLFIRMKGQGLKNLKEYNPQKGSKCPCCQNEAAILPDEDILIYCSKCNVPMFKNNVVRKSGKKDLNSK